MTDERFRAFDAIDPPDQWDDITRRQGPSLVPIDGDGRASGRSARTLLVAAAAVVAFAVGGVALAQARSDHSRPVRSAAGPAGAATTRPAEPPPCLTPTGEPVPTGDGRDLGRITIAAIGLSDSCIGEGIDAAALRLGIGHDPETPRPGGRGNVVLAGHRTTYGGPFSALDEVKPGDEVVIESSAGRVVYRVRSQHITTPDDLTVLAQSGPDRLTLITTDPKYSARQRLVVVADLVGSPDLAPPDGPTTTTLTVTTSADPTSTSPASIGVSTCTVAGAAPGQVDARGAIDGAAGVGTATVTLTVVDGAGNVRGQASVDVVLPVLSGRVPFAVAVPVEGDLTRATCRVDRVTVR